MPLSLRNAPQTALVDVSRRITREWLQALISSNSWLLSVDVSSEVTGTLGVGHGGTGRATLTAHDVLVGNGTSQVGLIDPGTAGFVLTSHGPSADPSFQAIPVDNSWIPLVDGSDPPKFITDGDGTLIVVAYA